MWIERQIPSFPPLYYPHLPHFRFSLRRLAKSFQIQSHLPTEKAPIIPLSNLFIVVEQNSKKHHNFCYRLIKLVFLDPEPNFSVGIFAKIDQKIPGLLPFSDTWAIFLSFLRHKLKSLYYAPDSMMTFIDPILP